MFLKEDFSKILKDINEHYENQTSFASASGVNRTYLSQYMNMKLDNPPSPKILEGIANASKGITTYEKLMRVCGYYEKISGDRLRTCRLELGLSIEDVSKETNIPSISLEKWENGDNYNAAFDDYDKLSDLYNVSSAWLIGGDVASTPIKPYCAVDSSMAPLLDVNDIAYVLETNSFKSGETILFSLDGTKYIRKVVDFGNFLEFHALNPYYPILKFSHEELEKKKFKVIGKIIKTEITSAFK